MTAVRGPQADVRSPAEGSGGLAHPTRPPGRDSGSADPQAVLVRVSPHKAAGRLPPGPQRRKRQAVLSVQLCADHIRGNGSPPQLSVDVCVQAHALTSYMWSRWKISTARDKMRV